MGITFGTGFISVAYGMLKLVISKGDPKATSAAISTITWGAIAVAISFFAIVIKTIVVNMTGVTGLDETLPDF